MATYYNYDTYMSHIKSRYRCSQNDYKNKLDTKNDEKFLITYEKMNVFPIFPRPIIMKLKTKDFDIKLEKNNNLKSVKLKLNDILIDKIKEFKSYNSLFGKNKNLDSKVRRFFDYEIKDKLAEILKYKVSNAWVKMYEILSSYTLFSDNETLKTFHLCEHPGAFVLATQEWIKQNTKKNIHLYFNL